VLGRTAVVVDDGLATGSTARAACAVLRAAGAERIVLAVPVAPAGVVVDEADELVVVRSPEPFGAVGRWYADFAPTSEQEVVDLLRR
jgi:putative phosphoribosyl transferase